MTKTKNSMLANEKGFTLIEIIAVLVILGILSAVAVPKFINLQEDARNKAALAAIAEVKARLSLGYGKYLLINGEEPDTIVEICGADGVNNDDILPTDADGDVPMGIDYTVGLIPGGTITVTEVQEKTVNVEGTWVMPSDVETEN